MRNPLSLLSRWKILDNLRRSLVPGALLLFLTLCWLIPIGSAAVWTSFIMAPLLVPIVLRSVVEFIKKPVDFSWGLHVRDTLGSLGAPLYKPCAL